MAVGQITIKVGDEKFSMSKNAWSKSARLVEMITDTGGNDFIIDGLPEVFSYVWRYLMLGIFPLIYDPKHGHDYSLYTLIHQMAESLRVEELETYLREQRYLLALRVEHIVTEMDDSASIRETCASNEAVQYMPQYVVTKRYVCPRNVSCHMGNKLACGKQCANAQGDDPDEYEDITELKVVKVKKVTKFNPEVLIAKGVARMS